MSLETSSNSKTPTHNKLLISKASIYSQIITLSQPIRSLPFGAIALPVSGNYVEDSGLETTANNALYTCINRSIDVILLASRSEYISKRKRKVKVEECM
jgi:hypothetical protein